VTIDLTGAATPLDTHRENCPGRGCGGDLAGQTAPLRVLHVIPNLGGGGSERFVLTLLPLLDREVCDPKLCVLGSVNAFPARTALVDVAGFLGYDGSLRNPRGMRRCIGAVRDMMIRRDIHIVHSHLWPAARLVAMALRGLPIRHVIHVHDTRPWLSGRGWRDRLIRSWTNRVIPRTKLQYVAVSNAVKEYTCRHLPVRPADVIVIPNGVDLAEFRPRGETRASTGGRMVVGTVARMEPEKGHRDLIAAFAQLVDDGLDVELRLAGTGSLRPQLEEWVNSAGISDRVLFTGLIDDVEAFLHQLDVFVLASVFGEGLPLTILEAMACRLPVIACDVGGAEEVIRNGESGVLISPSDAPALTRAIWQLADDSSRREAIATAGLETVRKSYSFEATARKIAAVYSADAIVT
jgi:glycosyltransferase involved in cell wall biosynthesis